MLGASIDKFPTRIIYDSVLNSLTLIDINFSDEERYMGWEGSSV